MIDEVRPGQCLVDRFEILDQLGEGGMGRVFRAVDQGTQQRVALKVLSRISAENLYLLKQEFRSLADIHHPNLVQFYELVTGAGDAPSFFTMELAEGKTPVRFIRGDLEPGTSLDREVVERLHRVFLQLATGLSALHDRGKVHRDVKPSNVSVLPDGRVVILDFGLAGQLEATGSGSERRHSGSSGFVGTRGYVAPEQARGGSPDPASDWYSFGVLLFESITGWRPYKGIEERLLNASEPPLSAAGIGGLSPSLDRLCQGLLGLEAQGRSGARHVFSVLEAADAETLVEGHPGAVQPPVTLGDADSSEAETRVDARPQAVVAPRLSAFVGRSRELQTLHYLYALAEGDEAPIALVEGVSGIGKTELIARFLAEIGSQARDTPVVLAGRCLPQETVPLRALDWPIDELSGHLVSLSAAEVAKLAPSGGAALLRLFPVLERVPGVARWPVDELPENPLAIRNLGARALRQLLATISQRNRIVLWIDDAQWGDLDSMPILNELLRSPAAPRLLLLLSYRSDEVETSPFLSSFLAQHPVDASHHLELQPLTAEESKILVDELLPGSVDLPRQAVDRAIEEAAGSPFFLAQLLRHLGASDDPEEEEVGVEAVVRRRLAGLSPGARSLLQVVAAYGRPVDTSFALEMAELPLAERGLIYELCADHLLRTGLAAEAETLLSYHDRVRESVLSTLERSDRRILHRRLAHGLEQQAERDSSAIDPEILYEQMVGAGENERAAQYGVLAAERAEANLRFSRAAQLFGQAAELQPERGPELVRRRAAALARAGRSVPSAEAFLEAARHCDQVGDTDGALAARGEAASQYFQSARLWDGLEILRGVTADLRVTLPRTSAEARRIALRRRLLFLLRRLPLRLPKSARDDPAAAARIDAIWAAVKGCSNLDHTLADCLSQIHLGEVIRLGDPSRLIRAVGFEATAEANVGGRWLSGRSRRLLDQVDQLSRESGNAFDRSLAGYCRYTAEYFEGRWRSCSEGFEQVLPAHKEAGGSEWEVALGTTYLFGAKVALGELQELAERLPVAVEASRLRGDHYSAGQMQTADVIYVPLAANDVDRALGVVEDSLRPYAEEPFTSQHLLTTLSSVQVHLYAGEPTRAWAEIASKWQRLKRAGFLVLDCMGIHLRWVRGRAAIAAARSGHRIEAGRSWDRKKLLADARSQARRIGRSRLPHAPALAAALSGAVAGAGDDADEQARQLEQAAEAFRLAEMPLQAAACQLHLAARPSPSQPTGSPDDAEAFLRRQGVVEPDRMARMLVPGF